MTITVWNCNGRFHEKFEAADLLDADILVIPECADENQLRKNGLSVAADTFIWVGDNPNKGLAVMARSGYTIAQLFSPSDQLPKWAAPIRISCPTGRNIDLLALWFFWRRRKHPFEIRTIPDVVSWFSNQFDADDLIVAGDFNNDAQWGDRYTKAANHLHTIEALAARGLCSAYHSWRGVTPGEETDKTHYRGLKDKGYPDRCHIDYVFLPAKWVPLIKSVDIGSYEDWVAPHPPRHERLSDHVPLTVRVPAIQ